MAACFIYSIFASEMVLFCQFGMANGFNYYNKHKLYPLLIWRKKRSEAQRRAVAKSELFIAIWTKTMYYDYCTSVKLKKELWLKHRPGYQAGPVKNGKNNRKYFLLQYYYLSISLYCLLFKLYFYNSILQCIST